MPRFSLKTLLIAAALVPLAIFTLVKATPFIAGFVTTAAVVVWLIVVVAWWECEGELRATARGFAIASLAYAILTWGGNPNIFGNSHLATTHLLHRLYALLPSTHPPSGLVADRFPQPEPFYFVGHVYSCLLVGLVCGWFAGWLYRRRQKTSQPNTEARTP